MRGLKNIRLPKYDYRSNGYYFVTVVSNWRENVFMSREHMVEKELKETVEAIEGAALDTAIVMSNHVHFILALHNCALPLGEIVRRFKAKVSYVLGRKAWQPNYYEHVIRNESALCRIREYIVYNPQIEKVKIDRFYSPTT